LCVLTLEEVRHWDFCIYIIVLFRVILKSCFCQLKPSLRPDSRTIFQLLIANIYSISAARGEFVIHFFFFVSMKLVALDHTVFD